MFKALVRRGYFHTGVFVSACGVFLCTTGCFLQRMPDARDDASPTPSRPVAGDDDAVANDPIPDEPAIEEPVRPVDDGADDPVADVPIEEVGDLNEDGILDQSDVELFRSAFGNFSDGALGAAADLDGDGLVTLVDFQQFLNMTAPEDGR